MSMLVGVKSIFKTKNNGSNRKNNVKRTGLELDTFTNMCKLGQQSRRRGMRGYEYTII